MEFSHGRRELPVLRRLSTLPDLRCEQHFSATVYEEWRRGLYPSRLTTRDYWTCTAAPEQQAIRATGTDGAPPVLAFCLALSGQLSETSVGAVGQTGGMDDDRPSAQGPLENSGESAVFQGKNAERAGFEPADRSYPITDLANRRFRPLSHLSGSVIIPCAVIRARPGSHFWASLANCAQGKAAKGTMYGNVE